MHLAVRFHGLLKFFPRDVINTHSKSMKWNITLWFVNPSLPNSMPSRKIRVEWRGQKFDSSPTGKSKIPNGNYEEDPLLWALISLSKCKETEKWWESGASKTTTNEPIWINGRTERDSSRNSIERAFILRQSLVWLVFNEDRGGPSLFSKFAARAVSRCVVFFCVRTLLDENTRQISRDEEEKE